MLNYVRLPGNQLRSFAAQAAVANSQTTAEVCAPAAVSLLATPAHCVSALR